MGICFAGIQRPNIQAVDADAGIVFGSDQKHLVWAVQVAFDCDVFDPRN